MSRSQGVCAASNETAKSCPGLPCDSLGFDEVPQWLAKADELVDSGKLDLTGIRHVDSAGLALLLELTRRAHVKHTKLTLVGAGSQVMKLANFFNLETILQFES